MTGETADTAATGSAAPRVWERRTSAQRLRQFALQLFGVAALVWAAMAMDIHWPFVADAPEQIGDLAGRMVPPDWPFFLQIVDPMIETINIATIGTLLGGLLSIPVALLAARANRAFLEYMPIRPFAAEPERIHRVIHYGPMLDVFFLDMRTFRADNGANQQAEAGPETTFLGAEQIRWLKQALLASNATWKVIAADMPIGIIVYDNWRDKDTFENLANGDGPVRGREHEIADVLRFIKHSGIRNTVWLTADVHYTAAHYYDPNKAQFQDFNPFWEFVSGPIHAGSFGPNEMDNTFGPQVMYQKAPPEGQSNLPPSAGLQFYGHVRIDGDTEVMTVTLKDLDSTALYSIDLMPQV